MGTVKPKYLKLIIEEAEQKRFKSTDDKSKSNTIMITDQWLHELNKYPFISSKLSTLTILEKPGKAIYLIKERSKLVRAKKSSQKHEIRIRLGAPRAEDEEMKDNNLHITKRRKEQDGSGAPAQAQIRKSSVFTIPINQ